MTLRRVSIFLSATALSIALVTGACASSSADTDGDTDVDPFAMADESESDLLDEDSGVDPDERRRRRPQRTTDSDGEVLYTIPEANSEPARTIDAEPDDWDSAEFRDFDDADRVYDGDDHWSGPEDTSFSAAVDVDDSHIFFFVGVIDDQVLASSPSDPVDAVVFRLRDPALDDLLASLPTSLRDQLGVHVETAVAVTPDGQFAPYDTNASIDAEAIETTAIETGAGYMIEVALSLEALPFVAEMPLDRLAFGIDVFDGDDSASSGPQKRLSAVPRSSRDRPSLATIDTGGLLPSSAPDSGPPRPDALGVWDFDDDHWRFRSLEYFSPRWNALDTLDEVAADILDTSELPEICHDSDSDKRMIEAYEASSESQRVALVLCGTASDDSSCDSGARSQLIWTALEPSGEKWAIEAALPVFEEPLEQCLLSPSSAGAYHHDFSMLPFDRIGPTVWGIGYHESLDDSERKNREAGVVLVDPESPDFVLAQRSLKRIRATSDERTRHDNRLYLTDLDDNDALDLCQIEEIREQSCDSLDSGCTTRNRGHEVISHIDLWDSSAHSFEKYLLSRHNDCRGSSDFDSIAGFQILLIGHRLGLLPTSGD